MTTSDINISTAQTCLIKAKTAINEEDRIHSLVMASMLIDTALKSYGLDQEKVKKQKDRDR